MILTDEQIKAAVQKGELGIANFSDDCIEPASYDIRVGEFAYTSTTKAMINLTEKGLVILEPGDFGVILTLEEIKMPLDMVARFGLKSSFARKGVFASTGPQIDPGFHGRLKVGLINLSPTPIPLTYKEKFCTLEFHRLPQPSSRPYSGPYQDQLELTSKDIQHMLDSKGMVYSEVLTALSTLSRDVSALTNKMSTLADRFDSFEKTLGTRITIFSIVASFILGVIAIVIALK
ncbi:MAG: dCTP deaminase [Acidobacteria bacterium RIFCSPLOWO2_12_FULL_59_11]|nr:MAG: dCTP deaminase [Acidobacteria bacterium RIFCSPLOWO2_12_FULL_59_11]